MDKQFKQNIEQESSGQQDLKDIISSREDGFGFLLRKAREERSLSLSEVAKELHLDGKFIQALESEDYTQLPAPAFVCGYIRNYAKLVGLQPEALIADYKKEFGNGVLEPELKVSKQKKISHSSIQSTLFVLLFKLLLLIVLVFGSWYLWGYISEHYINMPVETDKNIDLSVNTPVMEPMATADNDPESLALPLIDTSSSKPSMQLLDPSNQQAENIVENKITPADADEVTDELESSAVDETEELVVEQTVQIDETAKVEEPVINEIVPPVNDNTLILEFAGNSWIKIRDANKKTLSSGTKNSGVVLTLEGQRPYDITIGNANKVKVIIDGQVFDHSNFINENSIARFTIP